jgi:hypothetical protein
MGDGRKDDAGKLRWSLVPWPALRQVVRVLEHGARKYGEENWRELDDGPRRYWDAAARHMIAWADGETHDPESGINHLAHAACSMLFILALSENDGSR